MYLLANTSPWSTHGLGFACKQSCSLCMQVLNYLQDHMQSTKVRQSEYLLQEGIMLHVVRTAVPAVM